MSKRDEETFVVEGAETYVTAAGAAHVERSRPIRPKFPRTARQDQIYTLEIQRDVAPRATLPV